MDFAHTLVFGLLFSSLCVLAQEETNEDTHVTFEDIMGYTPNKTMAIIGGALYLFVALASIIWCFINWGRYMLTLVIGCIFYSGGLALRFVFASGLITGGGFIGLFILMTLSTLLAPCAFIATAYMLLGRLALYLNADKYLLIRARYITKLFVISDIVTLFMQAVGGAKAASTNPETSKLGSRILLWGLIAQLVSFGLYMVVYGVFLYRMRANRPEEWKTQNSSGFPSHWTALAGSIVVSCIGILVRTIFRTIESLQGPGGPSGREVFFYVLDTLPLFIAVTAWIVTWPPRYFAQPRYASPTYTNIEMGGLLSPPK